MFRSAGLYRRNRNGHTAVVSTSDEGPVLQQKWLTWVELESYKRYATNSLALQGFSTLIGFT